MAAEPSHRPLAGRTALVTGAGQGIGAAIARDLGVLGADVVVADRNEQTALEVAGSIGPSARAVTCDVTERAAFTAVLSALDADAGGIDVLVNNAGGTPHDDFLALDADALSEIVELNFGAVLTGCHALLPGMVERRFGRIVSVASDAARIGVPKESVYSGAKAGVIGFSKAIAAEVAHAGVTVNVVCPGSTETPLLASMYDEEQLERRRRRNPSGRLAQPADVADAVRFFVTGAAYVTGQVLSVNGGALRVG